MWSQEGVLLSTVFSSCIAYHGTLKKSVMRFSTARGRWFSPKLRIGSSASHILPPETHLLQALCSIVSTGSVRGK